jgi:ribosome-associated protein
LAAGKKRGESGRPKIRSSHGGLHGRSGEGGPAAKGTTKPRPKKASGGAARPAGARPAAARPTTARPAAAAGGPRTKKAKPVATGGALGNSVASDESRELAVAIAIAALDKKAVGLEVLDVAGKVDYADFLVLMTGRSDRQVAALAQGIEEALRKLGKRPMSVEGLPHGNWVLMDFGDVVVHVFQDDARSLYDIEGLWMDARRIPVPIPETMRD